MSGGIKKEKSFLGTDFTMGNVTGHLLRFMLPLLLAGMLNSLYNAIDTIVIGQFAGTSGNVAVSTGGKILMVITLFSNAMAGAGQVVLSQQLGQGRRDEASATIGTLFTLLLGMALVFGTVFLALSGNVIRWLNTPDNAFDGALAYMRITSLGMPMLFGYNACCTVLRGMGDSRSPLLFIAIAAGINLLLDVLFAARLDMGAAGTAWATVIAQSVSFLFAVVYLYHRRERFGFDFRLRSFRPDRHLTRLILRIGIPMSATGLFISVTQVFMQGFINACGEIQAAAYNVADKVLTLENVFSDSVQQAGSTIVAQNIGARETGRVRRVVHSALGITLPIALTAGLAAMCFPEEIFRIFVNSQAILAYSGRLMGWAALTFLLSAVNGAFNTVTTGTGAAELKLLGGFLDGIVLRISLGLFFGLYLGMGIVGFYMGHCLARIAPLAVNLIYYLSGKWETRQLI